MLPKWKKTTDLRDLQAHHEVGGIARKFQDMDDHARSSYGECAVKGGDVAGAIDDKIHSKMAKIYWF